MISNYFVIKFTLYLKRTVHHRPQLKSIWKNRKEQILSFFVNKKLTQVLYTHQDLLFYLTYKNLK